MLAPPRVARDGPPGADATLFGYWLASRARNPGRLGFLFGRSIVDIVLPKTALSHPPSSSTRGWMCRTSLLPQRLWLEGRERGPRRVELGRRCSGIFLVHPRSGR